jgi:hypothetical protein
MQRREQWNAIDLLAGECKDTVMRLISGFLSPLSSPQKIQIVFWCCKMLYSMLPYVSLVLFFPTRRCRTR